MNHSCASAPRAEFTGIGATSITAHSLATISVPDQLHRFPDDSLLNSLNYVRRSARSPIWTLRWPSADKQKFAQSLPTSRPSATCGRSGGSSLRPGLHYAALDLPMPPRPDTQPTTPRPARSLYPTRKTWLGIAPPCRLHDTGSSPPLRSLAQRVLIRPSTPGSRSTRPDPGLHLPRCRLQPTPFAPSPAPLVGAYPSAGIS